MVGRCQLHPVPQLLRDPGAGFRLVLPRRHLFRSPGLRAPEQVDRWAGWGCRPPRPLPLPVPTLHCLPPPPHPFPSAARGRYRDPPHAPRCPRLAPRAPPAPSPPPRAPSPSAPRCRLGPLLGPPPRTTPVPSPPPRVPSPSAAPSPRPRRLERSGRAAVAGARPLPDGGARRGGSGGGGSAETSPR